MSQRRVVVTGLGVITPVGNDVPSFWDAIVHGKSGVGPITAFDASAIDSKIAGEVKNFEPAKVFKNPKDARRTDRYTHLAMGAAKEAVHDAGIQNGVDQPERAGAIIGSGIGGLLTIEEQHNVLVTKGPSRISPFMIPMLISNIASGLIAMEFNLRGPNMCVVTACATASNAIGEAWRLIRDDEAEVMLAGGSEAAICALGVGGFSAMRALSTRNDAPEKASRPFDKDRDGFVMGEGAGVVVLEELEHAKKRGAKIYAEIVGYGLSADAHHMTSPAPEGEGAARAMKNALKRAGLTPDQIGYINAHGTSTSQGDICETQAIKSVFGDAARKVAVSSTKSMVGHLLGAAGSVEMTACLKAIETGILPPTINLDNPDPLCDLDYVPHTAREQRVDVVMNNSFGFGGHNSCLIAARF
jgi:3-oxoacyl-[acyl-carrier-protein] synthase II